MSKEFDEFMDGLNDETLPKEERKQALIDMMKLDEQEGNYQQPKRELTIEELREDLFDNFAGFDEMVLGKIFNWFKPHLKQE